MEPLLIAGIVLIGGAGLLQFFSKRATHRATLMATTETKKLGDISALIDEVRAELGEGGESGYAEHCELKGKLVAVEPGVTITGCYTESDGAWINCGVGCNCDGVFESALQDLEGEQTSERPMLRIDFETASTVALGSLSFGVAFTDNLGLTWTDLILLDVVAPDTHVQIGIAELISDSGGDGALNAGETATVNIFAENVGTTTALGVWARLTNAAPGLEITSCYALNEEKWATCDVACSCQSIPESINQWDQGRDSTCLS